VANQPETGGTPGDASPGEIDWDGLLAQLAAQPDAEGWVTLDEAARATGVSRSTLRSWYRKGLIASRMVPSLHGPQRLVPLDQAMGCSARSPRLSRQLDHARSLQGQIDDLRLRIEALEAVIRSRRPPRRRPGVDKTSEEGG
jgi:transposase-like protein